MNHPLTPLQPLDRSAYPGLFPEQRFAGNRTGVTEKLRNMVKRKPMTSTEMGRALGLGARRVNNRLRADIEAGRIQFRREEGRGRVYVWVGAK